MAATMLAGHGRSEAPGRQVDGAKIRTWVPLFRTGHLHFELWEGFVVTASLRWTTRARWRRAAESRPGSRWQPWRVGFIIVAVKIDW